MDLSGRKKKILAAVVEEYIRTAEPVGSKTVAQTADLGCSSATIRNELAELASMGYLEQPHTSAGRVPTPQGYRMYVNELMEHKDLTAEETQAITQSLTGRHQRGEKIRVINKVLPQALLVAEIAVVNAFFGLAHAMLLWGNLSDGYYSIERSWNARGKILRSRCLIFIVAEGFASADATRGQ